MEKIKNVILVVLFLIVGLLSCICVCLFNELKQIEQQEPIKKELLTEEEALTIGKKLYEYVSLVGHCKIFQYSDNQEIKSIVLNYEEVASHFTNGYIKNEKNFKKNVFDHIFKDEDGNYRTNGCGFGLAHTIREVTNFDLISIAENYITFSVTINVKGYEPLTSQLVMDETTTYPFGIKKENDTWLIDYYEFAALTNLDIK